MLFFFSFLIQLIRCVVLQCEKNCFCICEMSLQHFFDWNVTFGKPLKRYFEYSLTRAEIIFTVNRALHFLLNSILCLGLRSTLTLEKKTLEFKIDESTSSLHLSTLILIPIIMQMLGIKNSTCVFMSQLKFKIVASGNVSNKMKRKTNERKKLNHQL